MRTWLFSLVAASMLAFAPSGQSGEIIKETFELTDGSSISGWVYQSKSTWRYRRSARYWGGWGFYGGYYSYPYIGSYGCYRPSIVRCGSYTHRHIAVAPTVRPRVAPTIIPRSAPTITPRSAPIVASVTAPIPRPSPTPTVKPNTVVKTISSSTRSTTTASTVRVPTGTTTMRVYRKP